MIVDEKIGVDSVAQAYFRNMLTHVSSNRAARDAENKYMFIDWKTINPAAQDSPVSNTNDFYDCYTCVLMMLMLRK